MRTQLVVIALALAALHCGGHDDGAPSGATGSGAAGVSGPANGTGTGSATPSGGDGGGGSTPEPPWTVDMVVEEALGPFDSWANAVDDYGAVGDGRTDDTAALQAGFDDMNTGAIQVLYLPGGTYRLTGTLRIEGSHIGVPGEFGPGGSGLIGADPATTTLKWDGPSGGAMLVQDGGTGYRYSRLTWDGNGTAGYGVAEWWDDSQNTYYGGSDEHQDEVFRDMAIGIMGGRLGSSYGNLDSEGQIRRVRFVNNTYAGLDTGSFNALDWWVFESSFEGCARGVANTYSIDDSGVVDGAGAMYVYRSNFSGSTVADVDLGNAGWFSLHDNVSIGSKLFIQTATIGDNPSPLIAERNRVVQPGSDSPINFGSAGALMLVDNQIESVGAPFTITNFADDTDVLMLGNTFTVDPPTSSGAERFITIDNQTVAMGTISTMPLSLPATPPVTTHAVFEVPDGANAAAIQSVIDQAVQSDDSMPIVHFGRGTWDLDATLLIPANERVQIVGDGWQSLLVWTGVEPTGPMIRVAGPTRFWMRNMRMLGNYTGVAVQVDQADQPGGRVLVVGTENGSIRATGLEATRLALQANPYIGTTTLDDVKNGVSLASGPFDVLTMKNGSTFEMADSWYEGPAYSGSYFNIADGKFTYIGGHFAPAAHGGTQTVTPLLLDGSKATSSWIAMQIHLVNVPSGIGAAVENEQPETKAYFFGNSNATADLDGDWFSRPGSGGEVSFMLNRHHLTQYENQGDTSDDAVRATWAQTRALPFDAKPYSVPEGATDVNLYLLDIPQTGGLTINGN